MNSPFSSIDSKARDLTGAASEEHSCTTLEKHAGRPKTHTCTRHAHGGATVTVVMCRKSFKIVVLPERAEK